MADVLLLVAKTIYEVKRIYQSKSRQATVHPLIDAVSHSANRATAVPMHENHAGYKSVVSVNGHMKLQNEEKL